MKISTSVFHVTLRSYSTENPLTDFVHIWYSNEILLRLVVLVYKQGGGFVPKEHVKLYNHPTSSSNSDSSFSKVNVFSKICP